MSQTFTRNNCGPGYAGSQVTYTVPANTHSSTISQADADSKAQADIIANGQNYANTNGTCIQVVDVTGSNSRNRSYTVTVSGAGGVYTLSSFASNVTLGQIPPGTYNVSFSPQGSPITVTFTANGFVQSGVGYATFYNISVTSGLTLSVY